MWLLTGSPPRKRVERSRLAQNLGAVLILGVCSVGSAERRIRARLLWGSWGSGRFVGVAADSVEDVERVSQSSIEFGSFDLVEVSNRLSVKRLDGNSDDVVAADDARLGKAFVRSYRDLGSYASGGAGDRRACDRYQD